MSAAVRDVGFGVLVGPSNRGELAARLGLEDAFAGASWLPEGARQVVLLVESPADEPLVGTDEDDLAALFEHLKDVVHQVQETVGHFRSVGTEGATIAVLLPADAALGRANASLAGALTDGLMSFFRTIAIELRKEDISVNVVFYDSLDEEDAAVVGALLGAYRNALAITGQETYTGRGPNLGKVKP
ncbi:hypothetical protein JL108_13125 [Aeromicrobium sp. YIM 150415]|uniref:hypothetical protein n=1 Tax=Aeromicrobium sp. YIM 150415 TaxID=2803912 RepID=UPI001962EB89|nr:hypothetical protein [Aeromicrobium sp. YIM 150415]MBM9464396.1 hypothetical protein [Aeromicrobium sp. YIM 150415]